MTRTAEQPRVGNLAAAYLRRADLADQAAAEHAQYVDRAAFEAEAHAWREAARMAEIHADRFGPPAPGMAAALLAVTEAADVLIFGRDGAPLPAGQIPAAFQTLAGAVDGAWSILRPGDRPEPFVAADVTAPVTHALNQAAPPPADVAGDPDAYVAMPTPVDIAPVDEPDVEPSPAVVADMRRIAAGFRGVEYDSLDRPDEVAAVVKAARMAGLIPVPSTTITPRSYRGCTPPPPAAGKPSMPVAAAASVDAAAQTLAELTRPLLVATFRAGYAAGAGTVAPPAVIGRATVTEGTTAP